MTTRPKIQFHFLTLFPEAMEPFVNSSLIGKAKSSGLASFGFTQIRDFADDKHRRADDTPYGGGVGMVLKADVLHRAWKSTFSGKRKTGITLLMSPQGSLLTPEIAKRLATHKKIVIVAGHYEGVDERFIDECVDEEISIGDYVLTGGELPALVVADAILRMVPGVVGKTESVLEDSFERGLLKYPQYTKPREFLGHKVPDVLLSGDHEKIREWREKKRYERTLARRPELLSGKRPLTNRER